MAVLLPAAVFLTLWRLALLDSARQASAFVEAAIYWGTIAAVGAEVLSLFEALTPWGELGLWALALLLSGAVAVRQRSWRWVRRPTAPWWEGGRTGGVLLLALAAIAAVLLFVALVSPPNNTDSHLYHMSRVVHWAQNRSLRHYPVAYEPQLVFPPFAEVLILHLRLLWGNDRLAALPQWFSMVASLVAVSAIGRRLGARPLERLLGLAYVVSLPMGVLQATSTQNDYVAGFWLLALAYYSLLLWERADGRRLVGFGLALGLGLLTKGTVYAYCLPFLALAAGALVRHYPLPRALPRLAGAGALAGLLNLGFWLRNVRTYGTPLGPSIGTFLNRPSGIGSFAADLLRELALHLATPSEPLNRAVESAVVAMTTRLGGLTEFRLTWLWNHEDLAGSPLHLMLFLAALVAVPLLLRRDRTLRAVSGYLILVVGSLLTYKELLVWQIFNLRLHLPFFLIAAPVVGMALGRLLPRRLGWALAFILAFSSLPWVLLNRTRPLIDWRPRTSIGSILREPPETVLFANWTGLRGDYMAAADQVRRSGCRQVGLWIDSHDLEYPFWWLLEAPQSGIRIEAVRVEPPYLQQYVDPAFEPCAVLSTVAGDRQEVLGLRRVGTHGTVAVFGRPELFAGVTEP